MAVQTVLKSIERFIEDQAFWPSYVIALPPPLRPLPHSRKYKLDRRHTGKLMEEGKGVGQEPKHTTARKPGPLYIIQYSLDCSHLSGYWACLHTLPQTREYIDWRWCVHSFMMVFSAHLAEGGWCTPSHYPLYLPPPLELPRPYTTPLSSKI